MRKHINKRLQRKIALTHAKPTERASRRIVRVVAKAPDVSVLILVGADCVGACALEHRSRQARVRSAIEVDLAVEAGQHAVLVTAERESAQHRMALRMEGD